MPTIKTGGWLRRTRGMKGWTQEELAECAGVSTIMVRKVEGGERLGSADFWDKVIGALDIPEALLSYDSQELLASVRADIVEYGLDEPCALFYTYAGESIVFVGYDFLTDSEAPELDGAERVSPPGIKVMLSNLGDAYDLFEHQDAVL